MELLKALSPADYPGRTITYTDTAGVTDTWKSGPQGVLIWATTDAYVTIGEGVTATSANIPIPAMTAIPFAVPQGTGAPWRVSALQISSGGSVYAKPINIQ
jgi:hypothetical protein